MESQRYVHLVQGEVKHDTSPLKKLVYNTTGIEVGRSLPGSARFRPTVQWYGGAGPPRRGTLVWALSALGLVSTLKCTHPGFIVNGVADDSHHTKGLPKSCRLTRTAATRQSKTVKLYYLVRKSPSSTGQKASFTQDDGTRVALSRPKRLLIATQLCSKVLWKPKATTKNPTHKARQLALANSRHRGVLSRPLRSLSRPLQCNVRLGQPKAPSKYHTTWDGVASKHHIIWDLLSRPSWLLERQILYLIERLVITDHLALLLNFTSLQTLTLKNVLVAAEEELRIVRTEAEAPDGTPIIASITNYNINRCTCSKPRFPKCQSKLWLVEVGVERLQVVRNRLPEFSRWRTQL